LIESMGSSMESHTRLPHPIRQPFASVLGPVHLQNGGGAAHCARAEQSTLGSHMRIPHPIRQPFSSGVRPVHVQNGGGAAQGVGRGHLSIAATLRAAALRNSVKSKAIEKFIILA
jgi:hypothetical protein